MDQRTAPATLSYSAAWEDTLRMLRANAGLLAAIAGVFLFLPALLVARYLPPPEGAAGADMAQFWEIMGGYFQAAWPWLMLSGLVNMVGFIAIYLLLLGSRMTVGAAVARALPILPFFFILTMVTNLAFLVGFMLFIVPGIYLLGRLILSSAILVVETPRSPFEALGRSWRMSQRRGWTIALLVVLFYIVAYIISFAIQAGLGSVVLLLLGREGVGGFLAAALEALVGAAVSVAGTVLVAAIYRAIAARAPNAQPI